jgi:hypothetical protein
MKKDFNTGCLKRRPITKHWKFQPKIIESYRQNDAKHLWDVETNQKHKEHSTKKKVDVHTIGHQKKQGDTKTQWY